MKHKETVKSVLIHGKQWRFLPSFFTPNRYIFGGATCKGCHKRWLKKDERVDVEFFGNDLVSYCLKCWPKAIFAQR